MPKKLKAHKVSIPKFPFVLSRDKKSYKKLTLFDLSSHARAKEALDFGLSIREPEFNIFVIGEDRTGRLQSTLDYIENYWLKEKKVAADDWVYLYNFDNSQVPLPFNFSNGESVEFEKSLKKFVGNFTTILLKHLNSEVFVKKVKKTSKKIEESIQEQLEELREYALHHDIDIIRNPDGTISPVHIIGEESSKPTKKKNKRARKKPKISSDKAWQEVSERLQAVSFYAENESEQLVENIEKVKRKEAEKVLNPLFQKHLEKYEARFSLQPWLGALKKDILDNLKWFAQSKGEEDLLNEEAFENRYAVNIFVRGYKDRLPLIVEPNPTYENIFGRILYKNTANGYTTNFSMISPGSLHLANGGVLVLRADALAQNPETWKYLKDALRDRVIRTEELHRTNSIPMLEAPKPKPIPLDVKVILIGSPLWFYNYFYLDADFKTYFKIKAEISPCFEASSKNILNMGRLLHEHITNRLRMSCSQEAIAHVMGYSARLSGDRKKLSAHFESLLDIIIEAGTLAGGQEKNSIGLEHIKKAITMRDHRNALFQQQTLERLHEGILNITTQGEKVGQINGLTVQDVGGFTFGSPSRITAQSSVGDEGVINIEHMVEMSGPIQHKGVLILEGFLRGTFARTAPLTCNCFITFEQTYVGVEGDSASAAELCAILSSLSGIPLRQNLALTGAINQFGEIQAVGGINEKVEGFFHACKKSGLTGDQGVLIPQANERNLLLSTEVVEAIEKEKFHLWSVKHVTEAISLLSGEPHRQIFSKVQKTLDVYGKIYLRHCLSKRDV